MEGSSAALPCGGGTYGGATGLVEQAECTVCPAGAFCFAGSTAATSCSKGTYAAAEQSQLCDACPEGKYQGNEGASACTECGDGFTCPEGSVVQIPASCDPGTYLNVTLDVCVGCPTGSVCAGGASQPRPCARGGFCAANASQPTDCPAGRYGSKTGLSDAACSGECAQGYYCEVGSVSAKAAACEEGTYGGAPGLVAQADCTTCLVGHACPEGADAPEPCSPGSVASTAGLGACAKCGAGSFMNVSGQSVCFVCPAGSYCTEGAAAALPCPGGTFSGSGGLGASDQCSACPAGSFCFAGATEAAECSKGTYAASERSQLCAACPEGKYQNVEGAMACDVCEAGFTCPEGSVVQIPATCPPGTSLNVTLDVCVGCPVGSWCPGGQSGPVACSIGSFNPTPNASDTTACRSCEAAFDAMHLVTVRNGASGASRCVCDIEYFDAALTKDTRLCKLCTSQMLCNRSGLTLATVYLQPSRWRHSNRTDDIRICHAAGGTSACLGGDESGNDDGKGYCAHGHEGPRCEWCSDSSLFYDATTTSCNECGNLALFAVRQLVIPLAIVAAFIVLCLALVRVLGRSGFRGKSKILEELGRAKWMAARHFGLQAK